MGSTFARSVVAALAAVSLAACAVGAKGDMEDEGTESDAGDVAETGPLARDIDAGKKDGGTSKPDAAPDGATAKPDAATETKDGSAADATARDAGTTADASTPEASVVLDASTDDDSGAVFQGTASWTTDATAHRCQRLARFAYDCPANGTPADIWGNYIYTDDSSICTAAVHDGKIDLASGGRIVVEMRPGENIYRSFTKNGITSKDYTVATGQPQWPCSFVLWPY
ncbi:MAG: LCCL domain-containing protein [Polyangiaceae bacterium]